MSAQKHNFVVIVPVFNPEPGLIALLESLGQIFKRVLVVDDGSRESIEIFEQMPDSVKLIRRSVNQGKGKAMKDGMAYVKISWPDALGVVFVDGDGQHRVEDVLNVARLADGANCVALGVRDFSKSGIPLRSRFGNVITSFLVRRMYRFKIYDTQTGLRAIPIRLLDTMLAISGDRYEYEMRLFGELYKNKEQIKQVPIETIYLENNRASHFRPIVDSLRVYHGLFGNVFAKFCTASIVGFAVDNIVFTCALFFLQQYGFVRSWDIMVSFIAARGISASINFTCNKFFVFSSNSPFAVSFCKYWLLCLCIASFSYLGTLLLTVLLDANGIVITCLKIFMDIVLFVVSYKCQQRWIFRK